MKGWAVVMGLLLAGVFGGVGWLFYYMQFTPQNANQPSAPTTAAGFDTQIPAGQIFVDSETSKRFKFDATVRLGDKTATGYRTAIFDVLVTNKGEEPIRHLSVGGILDPNTVEVIDQHVPFFGTATDEDHNLVPGQIPYGIYVTRIAYVRDPDQLGQTEKQALLNALRAPIHLKLKWQGGVEYIKILPDHIQYNF